LHETHGDEFSPQQRSHAQVQQVLPDQCKTMIAPLEFNEVVIATRNIGKLREFRDLLRPTGWQITGLGDLAIGTDYEESGSTFAENARLKAIACSRHVGSAVIADDSGLEVAALGGRPGVYSARYAGPSASDSERISKLQNELAGQDSGRDARFVCAIALARNGNLILESWGECSGEITTAPRGTNGFGYDPIFLFPELGKTFAELNQAEKNLYSHRARAVRSLIARIRHWQSKKT